MKVGDVQSNPIQGRQGPFVLAAASAPRPFGPPASAPTTASSCTVALASHHHHHVALRCRSMEVNTNLPDSHAMEFPKMPWGGLSRVVGVKGADGLRGLGTSGERHTMYSGSRLSVGD